MRPYEAILILDASADDDAVKTNIDKVKDLVTSKSGTVGQVDKWGRRRFAYELKHRWEGNYTLMQLNAEPTTIADLDRMLTLSDDVIRHKIVRVPDAAVALRSASAPKAAEAAEPESGKK